MVIFGAFVLATGFVDNLVIDGKPFSAEAGPKHVLAGFAALVAGRYRQERELEEGKEGMAEVDKMESRFGKDGLRPTPREVSMCLDHREELEKKQPRNPTSHKAFADGRWKEFTKVRDSLIEKATGKKGGLLDDSNPKIWYKQIETLEMEVEGQGWDLQGPEICRILWDILPLHWRTVLKETKAYKSLLKEDFKDAGAQVVTSRYTGLVTAIYENFGNRGMHEYGTSITANYRQGELESTYAFAERIRSSFSKDLGTHWHAWPDAMRAAYARKFVEGLTEEDHKSSLVPTAERIIESSNWADFAAKLLAADEEIGPRATRVRRVPQALCQTSEVPAAWPTQFAAVAGHPANPAGASAPGFLPAQPHPAAANTAPNTVPMPTVGPTSQPIQNGNTQWAGFHGVPMSCAQIQGVQAQDESVARVKDGRCTHCLDAVPGSATHPDPCTNDIRCHQCLIEGHVKRDCTNQPAAAAGQQQQQPARGGGGRGRGRGRGGFRPHNNPAPAAEPVNQISPMHQRFTGSQAVNSVSQQPDHQHASGQQPHRGPRRPRQHHQQPHRGQRSQNNKNNKQRKNGTKPFKLTREMLEIERVERRLIQLVNVVGAMVGDVNTLWAGQFKMHPIMGYPPPIGQVSQLAQGGQMHGGGGVANDSRNLHVPHHHHCGASGERKESRVDDNNALYSSNKDYHMSLNGERGRGQWGVRHDAPHTPTRAAHDACDGPPNPYDDENEGYDDDYEGEGHDDSDDYDYEYEGQ